MSSSRTTIEERFDQYVPKSDDCPFIQILMQNCQFQMSVFRNIILGQTELTFHWYIPGSGVHRKMAGEPIRDCDKINEAMHTIYWYNKGKVKFLKDVRRFIKGAYE